MFTWSTECDEGFGRLQHLLTSTPILGYPVPNGLFIIDSDASDSGIGAVLSQVQEGQENVIAYFRRTLTRAERNYCVTRRELLALITGIEHFHYYLSGRQFVARTDHVCLQWLLNFQCPEGQLQGGYKHCKNTTLRSSIDQGKAMEMRTHCHDVPVVRLVAHTAYRLKRKTKICRFNMLGE